jgi:hypothetical protein
MSARGFTKDRLIYRIDSTAWTKDNEVKYKLL